MVLGNKSLSSTSTFRLCISERSISSWARVPTIGLIPLIIFIFLSVERQNNIPGRYGSADPRGDMALRAINCAQEHLQAPLSDGCCSFSAGSILSGLELGAFLKQNCRCWPAAFSWTKALPISTEKPKAGPYKGRSLGWNWKDQSPNAAPQLLAAGSDMSHSYAE